MHRDLKPENLLIDQWGRLEDFQMVGDIEDADTIDAIGAAWLAPRSQPLVSHVVNTRNTPGATAGVDAGIDRTASGAGVTACSPSFNVSRSAVAR
jgi:serine/threonine protein kinase